MSIQGERAVLSQYTPILTLPSLKKDVKTDPRTKMERIVEDTFYPSTGQHVRIDGKSYKARKVDENHVLINGNKFKVYKTANPRMWDTTMDVVWINGKQYPLKKNGDILADLGSDICSHASKSIKKTVKES